MVCNLFIYRLATATLFITVRDDATWASFRRHSSFKGRTESLEGVVESAVYERPVEEFLPLLCMGGLDHVGKRAVFGLERYWLAGVAQ